MPLGHDSDNVAVHPSVGGAALAMWRASVRGGHNSARALGARLGCGHVGGTVVPWEHGRTWLDPVGLDIGNVVTRGRLGS